MTDEDKQKVIEEMIGGLVEDDESLESMLRIITGLKDSGSLILIEHLVSKRMPGSTQQLQRLLDSNEVNLGFMKMIDIFIALMATISQEPTSRALTSILYNGDDLWESMIVGAKKPDNYSLLRLMGMFKDPDLASGLTAVLNALKELGKILKTV
ncbi:MAG: DUF1641 domain-containing protein [Thermoplasmataceae archaeon]